MRVCVCVCKEQSQRNANTGSFAQYQAFVQGLYHAQAILYSRPFYFMPISWKNNLLTCMHYWQFLEECPEIGKVP
jgi:hypothetical protein